ncbi:hypothetical protein E5S69_31490 [Cupriavidus necator]|uniref:hypothetical protein n=1 Tax=Cupriavidus necator TaxID=106590 RepID=UPI00148F8CF0|nr:hypothetical protein [Cupriavidus necator]NOV28011.1 hypothetical protein [Cupriavidus necator]
MAITYIKAFQPVVLGTSLSSLYVVPVQPTTNLLRGGRIRLSNTTSGAVQVSLHAVPVGGSASDGNKFLPSKSIPANDYMDVDVPAMQAGDFIQAIAGAASSITAEWMAGALFS